jgi:hypothetical protein
VILGVLDHSAANCLTSSRHILTKIISRRQL